MGAGMGAAHSVFRDGCSARAQGRGSQQGRWHSGQARPGHTAAPAPRHRQRTSSMPGIAVVSAARPSNCSSAAGRSDAICCSLPIQISLKNGSLPTCRSSGPAAAGGVGSRSVSCPARLPAQLCSPAAGLLPLRVCRWGQAAALDRTDALWRGLPVKQQAVRLLVCLLRHDAVAEVGCRGRQARGCKASRRRAARHQGQQAEHARAQRQHWRRRRGRHTRQRDAVRRSKLDGFQNQVLLRAGQEAGSHPASFKAQPLGRARPWQWWQRWQQQRQRRTSSRRSYSTPSSWHRISRPCRKICGRWLPRCGSTSSVHGPIALPAAEQRRGQG